MSGNELQKKMAPALQEAARQFARLRAAPDLVWAQEKAYMLQLLEREPKTRLCTEESLVGCILQAASMGLTLNPLRKLCYIIPRKERKRAAGESDAEYERVPYIAYASPSYQGLIDVSVRSGLVRQVAAEIVFQTDHFRYFGPVRLPEHEATTAAAKREHKHAIGVYAGARLATGADASVYLDRDQVERIRKLSEMPNSLMWDPGKLWSEGWKKAAIRRLWKTLPSSTIVAAVENYMNAHEGVAIDDGERAIPVPPPALVDEAGLARIRAELAHIPAEQREKWEPRLADKYGARTLERLEAQFVDEACGVVRDALALAKAKAAERAATTTTAAAAAKEEPK